MVIISRKQPKTMRILRDVSVGYGKHAIEGDVWEVSRFAADMLISSDSAERVIAPDEIVIEPSEPEVISEGKNDPAPKPISKGERKPRARIPMSENLASVLAGSPMRIPEHSE